MQQKRRFLLFSISRIFHIKMKDEIKLGAHPLSGHPIRFGVMGSADGNHAPETLAVCRELGRSIARNHCCLLTGACPGLPQAAALGAKEEIHGHTIGISPAVSFKEHVEVFDSPWQEYDVLIYTGLGFMGRELINIRSSDIIVVVGGSSGTLGEFAIAYDEGKLIGVLIGTGGVADVMEAIQSHIDKSTGAEVIYDSDPDRLVSRLLARFHDKSYKCPCHPSGHSIDSSTDENCLSEPRGA
jgi:uncharacterized protein (TIGR00725 family)